MAKKQTKKLTVEEDSSHSTSLPRSRRTLRQKHRTRQLSWIFGDPAHIIIIIIIIIMTKVSKAPQTCQNPGRLCTRGSPEDEKVMYNPKSKRLTALKFTGFSKYFPWLSTQGCSRWWDCIGGMRWSCEFTALARSWTRENVSPARAVFKVNQKQQQQKSRLISCLLRQGCSQTPSTGLRHPSFNHCRI